VRKTRQKARRLTSNGGARTCGASGGDASPNGGDASAIGGASDGPSELVRA
jgi:hypothetical protein